MAVIRLERVGTYNKKEQFDGIAEALADLPSAGNKMAYNGGLYDPAPGSIFLCIEDRGIHVRKTDGSWPSIAAAAAAESTEEASGSEEPGSGSGGAETGGGGGGENPGSGEAT